MSSRVLATVCLWLSILLAPSAFARTWVIQPTGMGDAPNVQAGIDSAAVGDTVQVACGVYHEYEIVMKSGICLTSETGFADCVTIDAQESGRVLYCEGVGATTAIVGFTLTGGRATGVWPSYCGAGLHCRNSEPQVTSCTITGNQADGFGGGAFFTASQASLTDCVITGNVAVASGGGMYAHGGSDVEIVGGVLSENQAADGGGLYCNTSSPILTGSSLQGNTATDDGGAVYCANNSAPVLESCLLSGNRAANRGGGLRLDSSSLTLTNCTIAGNSSVRGGGLECYGATALIEESILWRNEAAEGRNAYLELPESEASFSCCDVDTTAGSLEGSGAPVWIGTNVWGDPRFCEPAGEGSAPTTVGDYGVAANSPCLPENNGCDLLIGVFGQGCLLKVQAEMSWTRIKAIYLPNGQ